MDVVTSHSTLFIGGEWVPPAGKERIEVVSPASEEVIATVPAGTKEDIDRAVAAARRALESGPWPAYTLEERIGLVTRLRDLLVEHAEELAQVISAGDGLPYRSVTFDSGGQPGRDPGRLRRYRSNLPIPFGSPVTERPGTRASRAGRGRRRCRSVERAPVTDDAEAGAGPAHRLHDRAEAVARDAPGCVRGGADCSKKRAARRASSTSCRRRREVSEYLVTHPGVDKVTFTGSSAAGRRIAELCGHDLRRVTLELGGKSAAIILPDADLDQTVEALRFGSFRNNGQVCTLKTRLVVPAHLQDEFLDRMNAMLDTMPIGDPLDATDPDRSAWSADASASASRATSSPVRPKVRGWSAAVGDPTSTEAGTSSPRSSRM